jgi:hypothetical protein
MMASSPPSAPNSSSTFFKVRLFKHGSSSLTNASVVLPSGRELAAEISNFKMGTNHTSPTKISSSYLINKPPTAENTNSSPSEAPAKAPAGKGKEGKLETKKSKPLQGGANQAGQKGLSLRGRSDPDSDSGGDSV